jgi:hypothetical protein
MVEFGVLPDLVHDQGDQLGYGFLFLVTHPIVLLGLESLERALHPEMNYSKPALTNPKSA